MPRITPVTESEIKIGQRLRSVRKELLAPRTVFAMKLEISADQLASYEFGRVPLPWSVGNAVCTIFGVSQVWLATGDGQAWDRQSIHFDERLLVPLGARPLFSEVGAQIAIPMLRCTKLPKNIHTFFEQLAHRKTEDAESDDSGQASKPMGPFLSSRQSEEWSEFSYSNLREAFSRVPANKLGQFASELSKALTEVVRKYSGN